MTKKPKSGPVRGPQNSTGELRFAVRPDRFSYFASPGEPNSGVSLSVMSVENSRSLYGMKRKSDVEIEIDQNENEFLH